jgi:hypothetical protein
LIGGGAGLAAGLLIVLANNDTCEGDEEGYCDLLVGLAKTAVLVGTPLAGAALGALVGTLVIRERWVPGLVLDAGAGAVALGWTFQVRF